MGDAIRLSNQVYTNQTIIITSTTFVISKSNHKIQYITGGMNKVVTRNKKALHVK
jgi:hypothetical protein